MRPLTLIGIFSIVSSIGLYQSAPVLEKNDFQNGITTNRNVLPMTNQVLYQRDRNVRNILRNQINSAIYQAEDLFHEYVQVSTSLPDGYEITESELITIFPQVDPAVSQTFSLMNAATLLRQLTQSVTSLRAPVANTLTLGGSPIDGRLVDDLDQLVGQMNQILYRLPTTSNNLTALIVSNVDNDDQKRVMVTLKVTTYFLEYLKRNL
ncbi:hypothetical protein ACJMK2_020302 [Sinanodonta woodiana]|uniref:Uncharacterized protein n=1 Tax=Sinanodonta woodiana TaxID=1069815 RepID=A0ABD3TZ05_SINWO